MPMPSRVDADKPQAGAKFGKLTKYAAVQARSGLLDFDMPRA